MSEGTLQPTVDNISTSVFDVEFSQTMMTGTYRSSCKFSDFPRISTLRSLFASVIVQRVVAEARQDTLASDDQEGMVSPSGHIYIAIIPTIKDTDSATGSTGVIVNNVPSKQTFPLASNVQSNVTFSFNLTGFEVDLAQDPRRGAGPVAWIGNSGVKRNGKIEVPICTVTWRISVACSGPTPLWQ